MYSTDFDFRCVVMYIVRGSAQGGGKVYRPCHSCECAVVDVNACFRVFGAPFCSCGKYFTVSDFFMESIRAAMFFKCASSIAQARFAEPVLVFVNWLTELVVVFLR